MIAVGSRVQPLVNPFRTAFFRRIFKAQLVSGAIGLFGLLTVVALVVFQGRAFTDLAEQIEPSVRAADRMLLGVNRSVAALRGWVTLGDGHFLSEWDAAWKHDITPALALSPGGNTLQGEKSKDDDLTSLLRNLKESQWWVKEVARTPGNERARVVYVREVEPLIQSLERNLESHTQMLLQSETTSDRQRAVPFAKLLLVFTNSHILLDKFLDDKSPYIKTQLQKSVASLTELFDQQQGEEIISGRRSNTLFVQARRDFDAYVLFVAKIIQLAEAPDWNIAQHLLNSRTVPLATRVIEILTNKADIAGAQLHREAKTGMQISSIGVTISVLMLMLMPIGILAVSWLMGKRLTKPVVTLTTAVRRYSKAQLLEDIPVPPEEEFAELTHAFNRMRGTLDKASSDLRLSNTNLEQFTYSVSHDLRAPLRAINGFSQALSEDYGERLDGDAETYLRYLREGSQEMGELIDALLTLSRATHDETSLEDVNLSEIATEVAENLRQTAPERTVVFTIAPRVRAYGNPRLLRVVMENLLGNAWKYTSNEVQATIEFLAEEVSGKIRCSVCDNGIGFDMEYKNKLFVPFQRLHSSREFEGTGIGLSTVQRIIHHHGGTIQAQGCVGEGAIFTFELDAGEKTDE